jgi:hypothetical protein
MEHACWICSLNQCRKSIETIDLDMPLAPWVRVWMDGKELFFCSSACVIRFIEICRTGNDPARFPSPDLARLNDPEADGLPELSPNVC